MSATFQPPVKLHPGTQRTILEVAPTAASTHEVWFENQADSILLTLFVNSSAGDVDVSLYSVTQGGPAESPVHELEILTFPTVTGPTSTLLVEVASVTTTRLKLVATTTDAANFEVQARAINGGASDVRVVTAGTAKTDQKDINIAPAQVIIPPTLTSGIGFMCRNWSSNGATIYVSETQANAVPGKGWPLGPGDTFDISVKGGQTWYASSSIDGADLRILEGQS